MSRNFMSSLKQIDDRLPGEHVVEISPDPGNQQGAGRRRLNLFEGRRLSHQNLALAQNHIDRHLACLGQQLSPGVVDGLVASFITDASLDDPLEQRLTITAGSGLSRSGEDVQLPAAHEFAVGNLPVYAPPEVLEAAPDNNNTMRGAGESTLRPRRLGGSLRSLISEGIDLPKAGILLLEPVVINSASTEPSSDPCQIDIDGLAFADLKKINGVRLAFYAWPQEWLTLPPFETNSGTANAADVAGVNRWRSRLAYSIFRRELAEPMPWEALGVPVAMLGFDESWRLLFSDRHAVVRQGGQAHHRMLPVPSSGNPFLWQARIEQFAEQLFELDRSQIEPEDLANYFAWLPPIGGLPPNIIENLALRAGQTNSDRLQRFFPAGYRVEAAPIPKDQLELIFQESASLLPYDTVSGDASNQVKLLVPVEEEYYDPDLLKVEAVDPVFNTTLQRFVNDRAAVLYRRQLIRDRASLLNQSITGDPIRYPSPDPDQLEFNEKATPDSPFTSLSAHVSSLSRGVHEHGFRVANANSTLRLQTGDRLLTYVYLDVNNPPAQIMLTFQLGNNSEHRIYWGPASSRIKRGTPGTASLHRAGDLPVADEWVRLEIAPATVGLAPGNTITGMMFSLFDGRAAWGHTALLTSGGGEESWFPTKLPPDAAVTPAGSTGEPWLWLTARERLTPFEERYGTQQYDELDENENPITVMRVTAMASLTADLRSASPIDLDAVRIVEPDSDSDKNGLATILSLIPAVSPVIGNVRERSLTIRGVLSTQDRDDLIAYSNSTQTDLSNVSAAVRNIFRTAVAALFAQSQDNTLLENLTEQGLSPFITELEQRASEANDTVEFGFLQVRTDMFRVRQFVLGEEEASRLSVSPTLGAIAKEASASGSQKALNTFFEEIKANTDLKAADDLNIQPPANFESVRPGNTQRFTTAQRTSTPNSNNLFVESINLADSGISQRFSAADIAAEQLFFDTVPKAVVNQSPIVGKVNPSITIAERLKEPPAPETRNYTLAGRVSVFNKLAQNTIFKDISLPGNFQATFGQLSQNPSSFDANPSDLSATPDESEYFSSSVRVLDDTVAALRLAERRLVDYSSAIARAKATLKQLQDLQQQANRRLNVLNDDLAVTRHDVSVTRALLSEEQQRVDNINNSRRSVLENQVDFVFYHRPRSLGPNTQAPVRNLFPGVQFPARPACLSRPVRLPEALKEASALLRQSPINWFPHVREKTKQIDRTEPLIKVMSKSIASAKDIAFESTTPAINRFSQESPRYASAVGRTVAAQQRVASQHRIDRAQVKPGLLDTVSWKSLIYQASFILTLGDLIDNNSGELSRSASKEFTELTRALGCLYRQFSQVRPVIRLAWAEQLSQYDSPVNLRNFASLPRWGELDYLMRKEMQLIADWLYSRVSGDFAEAIALVNDLVRICILIASAAPVDQIIAGRVDSPTPVSQGSIVNVTINPAQVAIGMEVSFYDNSSNIAVATGIVEDLISNRAAARILTTYTQTVQLAANTRVRFQPTIILADTYLSDTEFSGVEFSDVSVFNDGFSDISTANQEVLR